MQALGLGGLEEGLPAPLVVPGLVGGAGFHRREDVDQAGVLAPGGEELLDPLLLPEILGAPHELDREAGLLGEPLGLDPNLVPERLGPAGVVEEPDLLGAQVRRHGPCVAEIGERAREHHPVEAGEHRTDLVGVSFNESVHHAA